MSIFDLPLEELQRYAPLPDAPPDFDEFWAQTLSAARALPLSALFAPLDFGLATVETYDVTFNGFGGQPIKGWLLLPRQRMAPLPCVVEFIGYGGGRGFPTDWLFWSAAGFAHLVMDTRGQGSAWLNGDTADAQAEGASPHLPGFMTLGILSEQTYYYRRLITDAVRAVEAARSHPDVDPERIAAVGGSQGGGLALAVAGLVQELGVTMPDVPFLCAYRRATEITDMEPYAEIAGYCRTHRDQVDRVFQTLAYFDGVNFATRARADALFSVGLMDEICPPSTVFAAFNNYQGYRQIRVYPYNRHDGGGNYHKLEQLKFLRERWPIT
jgi:cephalosporin-C deacetylase